MRAANGSSIRDIGLAPRPRRLRLQPRRPPGRHRQRSPSALARRRPVARREFPGSLDTGTCGFPVTGSGTVGNTNGRRAAGKLHGRDGCGCRRAGNPSAIICSGGPATGRDGSAGRLAHATGVHHVRYLGERPRTTSKNSERRREVTLPIWPVPMGRWSMRVTAVICAAVPVRKISSAR